MFWFLSYECEDDSAITVPENVDGEGNPLGEEAAASGGQYFTLSSSIEQTCQVEFVLAPINRRSEQWDAIDFEIFVRAVAPSVEP